VKRLNQWVQPVALTAIVDAMVDSWAAVRHALPEEPF